VTPITCSLLAGVLAAWPMATAQGQDTTYSPWRTRGMPSPETPTQARSTRADGLHPPRAGMLPLGASPGQRFDRGPHL